MRRAKGHRRRMGGGGVPAHRRRPRSPPREARWAQPAMPLREGRCVHPRLNLLVAAARESAVLAMAAQPAVICAAKPRCAGVRVALSPEIAPKFRVKSR